eukprot:764499-Hanusia_phi.AAC.2
MIASTPPGRSKPLTVEAAEAANPGYSVDRTRRRLTRVVRGRNVQRGRAYQYRWTESTLLSRLLGYEHARDRL